MNDKRSGCAELLSHCAFALEFGLGVKNCTHTEYPTNSEVYSATNKHKYTHASIKKNLNALYNDVVICRSNNNKMPMIMVYLIRKVMYFKLLALIYN